MIYSFIDLSVKKTGLERIIVSSINQIMILVAVILSKLENPAAFDIFEWQVCVVENDLFIYLFVYHQLKRNVTS